MTAPASMTKTGLLVVISGPSGVGKTTIVDAVRERLGGRFSVSATTRPRTAKERDGVDYHFLDRAAFEAMVARAEFLEHAEVFGSHGYGTPRRPVEEALARGDLVILDIDVQGAIQVRKAMGAAFMIFILPPSDEELLRRLRSRGRDGEEAIQRRFAEARKEIDLARRSGVYDAFVVNDDLEAAKEQTCDLIRRARGPAERPR